MKKLTSAVAILMILMFLSPIVLSAVGQFCYYEWLPIMIPIYNLFTGEVTWVQIGVYPVEVCGGGDGGTE